MPERTQPLPVIAGASRSPHVCLRPLPLDIVGKILLTFPIVPRKGEAVHRHYHTKATILQIYDAMSAAIRTGRPYQTLLDPLPADPSLAHDPSTRPEWL